MAESLGDAVLTLRTDDKGFRSGLASAEKQVRSADVQTKKLESSVAGLDKSMVKMGVAAIGAAAALHQINRHLRAGITDAIAQARATAQVETALVSTGHAAGFTSTQLAAMASEMRSMSLNSTVAITQMQSLLLTFTKIGRDVFPQAAQAVMDVATRMGTDLKNAAVQVGKALNDPILGVTALARSGIQFSEAQKEMIRSLVETNRLAEAQAIILAELSVQFGGSAQAAADAAGGGWEQMKVQLAEIRESIASAFLPAMDDTADAFGKLDDAIAVTNLGKFLTQLVVFPLLLREVNAQLPDWIKGTKDQVKWANAAGHAFSGQERALTRSEIAFRSLADAVSDEAAAIATATAHQELFTASMSTGADRISELEAAIRKVADRAAEDARRMREAWAMEDWLAEQEAAWEQLAEDTIRTRFVDAARSAALEMQGSFEDAMDAITAAAQGSAQDIHLALAASLEAGLDQMLQQAAMQPGPPPTAAAEQAVKTFEGVGQRVTVVLSQAIGAALKGDGGVNYEQLGSALGTIIGTAIAGPVGGAIGSVIGGMAGGMFDGGPGDPRSWSQRMAEVAAGVMDLVVSVSPLVGSVEELFNKVNLLLQEASRTGQELSAVYAAAADSIRSLRDEILGIDMGDFAGRLLAAVGLNRGLGQTAAGEVAPPVMWRPPTSTPGGPQGLDDGGDGPVMAFDAASRAAENLGSVIGEMSERFDVAGINIAAFGQQLVREFAGAAAALEVLSIQAAADSLRDAFSGLALEAEIVAGLIDQVTQAEELRIQSVVGGILSEFLDLWEQSGLRGAELAEQSRKLAQAEYVIRLETVKMEIAALHEMGRISAEFFNYVMTVASELSAWAQSADFRVPDARGFGGGAGRRIGRGRVGRGASSGPTQADERERLLAEWERFIRSGRDAHSFAREIRDLRDAFFGPGGFQERFRELGLSTRQMAAEFARMRDAIIFRANEGIRDVLRDLQLGTGGFGGASLSQQFFAQGAEFRRIAGLARTDLDQRGPLADIARSYIESIQEMFGGSRRGQALVDEVRGTLEGILGPDGLADPAVALDRERNSVLYDIRELLGGEGRDREEQMIAVGRDQLALMMSAHRQRGEQAQGLRSIADEMRRAEREKQRDWRDPSVSLTATGRP